MSSITCLRARLPASFFLKTPALPSHLPLTIALASARVQHAAPQPPKQQSWTTPLHPVPQPPKSHAAAAANVKFTERKARERAAAHCSTCMR
jgi:hypothetical protein